MHSRKLNMGKMYDVLSFIEHGAGCRQTMDCVQGVLLIEYLRENPRVEKQVVFGWFRTIAVNLEHFHRCRKRQNYKCLNPYSIVVSEDGSVSLLDMEAPDNGFVMKQMQKKAMRNHFLKPVYDMAADGTYGADLFAYGKTVRFILACADITPKLTGKEESVLSKISGQCIGERRKKFENFEQVMKVLPSVKVKKHISQRKIRGIKAAGGAAAVLSAAFFLVAGKQGIASGVDDVPQKKTESAAVKKTINSQERIELEAVRFLAESYEQEGMADKACSAYGRLTEIGQSDEEIEEAALKKMSIEAGMGSYTLAVQTGEDVLGRIRESEKISELLTKYKEELKTREEESFENPISTED